MEGIQVVFDIEELTGFVNGDRFQFVETVDDFEIVPPVDLKMLSVMDMYNDNDEGISLDFSFSSDLYDLDQSTTEEDLTTMTTSGNEDNFRGTLSVQDDHVRQDEISNSSGFKDDCENDSGLALEEKLVKMAVAGVEEEKRKDGLVFPWEDPNEDPPVIVDEIENLMTLKRLCEWCGKMFSNKYTLKTHQDNVHLGIRRFQCDYCDKLFYKRDGMMVHKRSRHTGEKPFECGICDKRFSVKGHHRQHVKRHIKMYWEYQDKLKGLKKPKVGGRRRKRGELKKVNN